MGKDRLARLQRSRVEKNWGSSGRSLDSANRGGGTVKPALKKGKGNTGFSGRQKARKGSKFLAKWREQRGSNFEQLGKDSSGS